MSQVSLWQQEATAAQYAELCNALYERELMALIQANSHTVDSMQRRLKSLPYYIKRTAHSMIQSQSPLTLDVQNAAWVAKQSKMMPLSGQELATVWAWYQGFSWWPGMVVPIQLSDRIVLDSVDRIDVNQPRFRTNAHGWFEPHSKGENKLTQKLLKPNKKVMSAACAGHCWSPQGTVRPVLPALRELLLSCAINWKNFKRPITV